MRNQLGCPLKVQHQRADQRREVTLQRFRRFRDYEQQCRIVLQMRPGVFDSGACLADAAKPVDGAPDDRRPAGAAVQALVQIRQERIASLEEAAQRQVRQRDRLRQVLFRPILLQDGTAKLILVGKIAPIQPPLDDMRQKSLLQIGIVIARRWAIRLIVVVAM
jgi:hypothetical protein